MMGVDLAVENLALLAELLSSLNLLPLQSSGIKVYVHICTWIYPLGPLGKPQPQ